MGPRSCDMWSEPWCQINTNQMDQQVPLILQYHNHMATMYSTKRLQHITKFYNIFRHSNLKSKWSKLLTPKTLLIFNVNELCVAVSLNRGIAE